ncbi:MAG TPA: DUF1684 domain-containing protein [Flavisolibacter sp.]|nr:DUF1684 domain-containing protein [Flavisolibacter sp.]
MKNLFLAFLLLLSATVFAQKSYEDSIKAFRDNYVQTHEVVKGENRKAMQFYPVDKNYRVSATLTKSNESNWITFPTSAKLTKAFKVYGLLSFAINGKPFRLNVYQSQELMAKDEFKNYLFLPFTDFTTGDETYEGGRYLDLSTKDIHNNTLVLDFNKAYNPYCAYESGKYNCPIPPGANALPVAIRAGEKKYANAQ